MPATVAASRIPHIHHSSRPDPTCRAPSRQARASSTAGPTRNSSPTKAAVRTIQYSVPTVALPDWVAMLVARASARVAPAAVPTENTKAPCTGCESAEITRHATT